MRIYVASKFENKDAVREAMQKVRERGHIVTHDWTNEDETQYVRVPARHDRYMRDCAQADVDGVRTAGLVIVLNHPQGKGMFVEMGIAIALGIPVALIDADAARCIFFHLPLVQRFESVDQALNVVDIGWHKALMTRGGT
jgi:nucleoside 2-deoxyribosyltransferase